MTRAIESWEQRGRLYVRSHGTTLFWVLVGFTAIVMLIRLTTEPWRLIGVPTGGIDLRLRYEEIQNWFSGLPVYTSVKQTGYPPASYVLLWPFLGWLGEWPARWMWAIACAILLIVLARLLIQGAGLESGRERCLALLFLLSIYPTAITIGNGQLAIHVVTALVGGLLLLAPGRRASALSDAAAVALLLFSLVKPSLSAPFFWIALFVPGRLRPMIGIVVGYAALTLLAFSFQSIPPLELLRIFVAYSTQTISANGGGDLAYWLGHIGLSSWDTAAAFALFGGLGVLVFVNRRADLWLLLGLSALVARLWTYHQVYDDLLIVFPIVALCRMIKRSELADPRPAVVLIGAALIGLEAPATLVFAPSPWGEIYNASHTVVWLAMLVFLLARLKSSTRTDAIRGPSDPEPRVRAEEPSPTTG